MFKQLPGMLLCAALSAAVPFAAAAAGIATVAELEGRAFVRPLSGAMRTLHKGDTINQGDRILTAKNGSLRLVFTDETELSLGSATTLSVDEYLFKNADENQGESRFAASILTGVVRAVTGLLAKRKPDRVRFKTKVATIGIRGTHFTAEVEGDRATIILLAERDAEAPNAIEVANEYGRVEIDQAGYGTEIPDAQSPPSPPRKMRTTENMNRILRSVQTTRRVRIPRSPIR